MAKQDEKNIQKQSNAHIAAHRHSINHIDEILQSEKCGCFHCLKIFKPDQIVDWHEDTTYTAFCPFCDIDSVIGDKSGYEITNEFLSKMEEYWFGYPK